MHIQYDNYKLKKIEDNFLQSLDNSVLRFKRDLPHHNEQLLNKILVENFIANSKVDFYQQYKDISVHYDYIYQKNKLLSERLDYIINLFFDMNFDIDYLDNKIKDESIISNDFISDLRINKLNYEIDLLNFRQGNKEDKISKNISIKEKRLQHYYSRSDYIVSFKRGLKQFYKNKISYEIKKLKNDIRDFRREKIVDKDYYNIKFRPIYLIPGVAQLSFNQLYKFCFMIFIFLWPFFIFIQDLVNLKFNLYVGSILVALEIFNIYDYIKISNNIRKGIRPNNIQESFIGFWYKFTELHNKYSKIFYYFICSIITVLFSFIIYGSLSKIKYSFIIDNINTLYELDLKVIAFCILLSFITFSIAQIISVINWRFFSTVNKKINLYMGILSMVTIILFLITNMDRLFNIYFSKLGKYVLHDISFNYVFSITFFILIILESYFNVYSIQKDGFIGNKIKYLQYNDNLSVFDYYRWVILPKFASKNKLGFLFFNFTCYYIMFSFMGRYFDHMISIYGEKSIDILNYFVHIINVNYYRTTLFVGVVFISILLISFNLLTKIKMRG